MSASATYEKLTVLAADFGLPIQWFNWAGGWLLGCEYCNTAGQIVELYEKGKITREQHRELFLKVANAKGQDDMNALELLKGRLRGMAKKDNFKWQKQADHFVAVKEYCQVIITDPASPPGDIAEAKATIVAMDENLIRLKEKHGVIPTPD